MRSISVIVPAYNAERTIAESLNSILAQIHPVAEVIVVDDGSTDATPVIARSFPAVRLIQQRNGGSGAAFVAGFAEVQTDIIAMLDADDLWTPNALVSQMAVMDSDPAADVVVGQMEEFICPSEPAESARRFRPRQRQPGWLSGGSILTAAAYRRVGPFLPLKLGAWIDWVHRARGKGLHFVMNDELVLRRRLHGSSLSMGADVKSGRGLLLAARTAIQRQRQQAAANRVAAGGGRVQGGPDDDTTG